MIFRKQSDGFTIVEVVIGLGIIMLLSGSVWLLATHFVHADMNLKEQVRTQVLKARLMHNLSPIIEKVAIPYWEKSPEFDGKLIIPWYEGDETRMLRIGIEEDSLRCYVDSQLVEEIADMKGFRVSPWILNDIWVGIVLENSEQHDSLPVLYFPFGSHPL